MIAPLLVALLFQVDIARPFPDDHGYAHTRGQTEALVRLSAEAAAKEFPAVTVPDGPWIAAVCPHDDHALAGPVYSRVMAGLRARRLILIGVTHGQGPGPQGLLAGDHSGWSGPLGFTPVDRELQAALARDLPDKPKKLFNVFPPIVEKEHSLEAFLPFIQNALPEVQIVPLQVQAAPWETLETLAEAMAANAAAAMKERHWLLGLDVQILISSDAVHYGDQGWGGKNYAPYGSGCEGLAKATANDRRLIAAYLEGPVRPERLKGLLYELVDERDLATYKVTWCGRFAIPFGLEFTRRLAERMGMPPPEGKLLAYSTSVESGQLDMKELPPTAPSNLRHWVGYAAMGWWAQEALRR